MNDMDYPNVEQLGIGIGEESKGISVILTDPESMDLCLRGELR